MNALSDDEIIVLSEINFKPFNASACFFSVLLFIYFIIVSAIQQMTVDRNIETPVYFKSVLKLPTIANVCVFMFQKVRSAAET